MQWNGRPYLHRHQRAKVEVLTNHLNREERPPCRLRRLGLTLQKPCFKFTV
jgi:hypothetical protein